MDIRTAINIVTCPLIESAGRLHEISTAIEHAWGITFDLSQTSEGIEIRSIGHAPMHSLIKGMEMLCFFADTHHMAITETIKLPDYGLADTYGWFGFQRGEQNAAEKTLRLVRTPRAPGRAPLPAPGEGGWIEGMFYLPTGRIEFYDDPTTNSGDDGWTIDELVDAIRTDGAIEQPLQVGRSLADLIQNGDTRVCAFNGNHRLAAARKLGMKFVPCANSEADDADPLSKQDVVDLGGRLA